MRFVPLFEILTGRTWPLAEPAAQVQAAAAFATLDQALAKSRAAEERARLRGDTRTIGRIRSRRRAAVLADLRATTPQNKEQTHG